MNDYERRQANRKAWLEERAQAVRDEANQVLRRAHERAEAIPFGQPILVGHYSERRDRNNREAIHRSFGKAFALDDKADRLSARAAAVGSGGISSDDPDAIKKLRGELEKLELSHGRMKEANAVIRKYAGEPEKQIAGLVAFEWLTETQARALLSPDFAGRIGFAPYSIANSSANITRIRTRIADLSKRREAEPVEVKGNGYIYREDAEENRVIFEFEGKPSAEVREILHRHAFHWTPSRGWWGRKLTNSGVWAGKMVQQMFEKLSQGKQQA